MRVMAMCLLLFSASPAKAQCAAQPEEGTWFNVSSGTNSFTKAVIEYNCKDTSTATGPDWYVHLWGKCEPDDCDWGVVGGKRDSDGVIRATYDFGFEKAYVGAQILSGVQPPELWLGVWTDFSDPNRADYGTDDWFHQNAAAVSARATHPKATLKPDKKLLAAMKPKNTLPRARLTDLEKNEANTVTGGDRPVMRVVSPRRRSLPSSR
jgi:hypothetical protein